MFVFSAKFVLFSADVNYKEFEFCLYRAERAAVGTLIAGWWHWATETRICTAAAGNQRTEWGRARKPPHLFRAETSGHRRGSSGRNRTPATAPRRGSPGGLYTEDWRWEVCLHFLGLGSYTCVQGYILILIVILSFEIFGLSLHLHIIQLETILSIIYTWYSQHLRWSNQV